MRRLLRSWRWRVAVAGHSMEPTLREGDWLLVDPDAYAGRPPAVGALVVVPDPGQPDRWLIKRVTHVDPEGYLALTGDHPAHRHRPDFVQPDQILVSPAAIVGRPWFRYAPAGRIGRVR
jgi:signal peptidase I